MNEIALNGLNVTFNFMPAQPANFSGHPDFWCPAEPAEVEILSVKDADRDIIDEMPESEIESMEREIILQHAENRNV